MARRLSLVRTVIDLRAVVDIKDVYQSAGFVDPVDDAIGSAAGPVASG